jgi:DNA-binding transcriptional regulator PaaX
MGKMEQGARNRAKNTKLQRTVLSIAESIAELTSEMLTGSVYKMYKLMDYNERRRKYRSILAARERLLKHGLLRRRGRFLELTQKGAKKLSEWKHHDYQLPHPKMWDGKWRILIFDIPEKRRWLRDRVRDTLLAVGFKRLQKSVWVYPFDCEDFITLLKADFKIGRDLLYLIVEGLENDAALRDYFEVYTG